MSRDSPVMRVNFHSRDGWAIEANKLRDAASGDPFLRISDIETSLEPVCLLSNTGVY